MLIFRFGKHVTSQASSKTADTYSFNNINTSLSGRDVSMCAYWTWHDYGERNYDYKMDTVN